jgi:hypothetical protein
MLMLNLILILGQALYWVCRCCCCRPIRALRDGDLGQQLSLADC